MKCLQTIGLIVIIFASTSFTCSQTGYEALRPSAHYWKFAESPTMQISRLSPSRKLATVGDTLYMLDSRNRILWNWTSDGPPFTDTPIIDSEETIHVIGYDLLWAAIDSATGHEKWRSTANGRATFWQIELYRRDFYLVVTNMSGYRESFGDKTIEDSVSLCRGNDVLWKADIPAKAHLKVAGDRVFVVYRRHRRTVRWHLHIPRRKLEPIGLVDGRLWDASSR